VLEGGVNPINTLLQQGAARLTSEYQPF